MGFYYARDKQKFAAEWDRLSSWYQAEGMSAEAIRELYQYDWAVFCRQRSFENRTQPLPEEPASVLYQKFAQLTTGMTDTDLRGRYDWIESLDDEELAGRLKKLSEDDRELLTQIVMDGLTKAEVARLRRVTRQSINDKIQRIKKFLKKV